MDAYTQIESSINHWALFIILTIYRTMGLPQNPGTRGLIPRKLPNCLIKKRRSGPTASREFYSRLRHKASSTTSCSGEIQIQNGFQMEGLSFNLATARIPSCPHPPTEPLKPWKMVSQSLLVSSTLARVASHQPREHIQQ